MLGERPAERVEELVQAESVGSGEGMMDVGQQICEREPEQLVDQRILAGESPVHGADAYAGLGGDLLHHRVRAGFAEDVAGCRHDPLVVAAGIAAQAAGLHGRRLARTVSHSRASPAYSLSAPATVRTSGEYSQLCVL